MESKLKYSTCPKCGKKSRRTFRPMQIKGYFSTNVVGYVCLTCGHFEPDQEALKKNKQYSVDLMTYLQGLETNGINVNEIINHPADIVDIITKNN